jgi:hypothetical protein
MNHLPEQISFNKPDSDVWITIASTEYVKLKTKQLREFGYTDLTEDTVATELAKVLDSGEGLTVIGYFINDEVRKTA